MYNTYNLYVDMLEKNIINMVSFVKEVVLWKYESYAIF